MTGFDPVQFRGLCEEYLSRSLGSQVRLERAERLAKSTRAAPWRLDVEVEGLRRSYVLRLDSEHGGHEYRVLQAMERLSIPTPRVYGWEPGGETLGTPCFLLDFIEGDSLLQPLLAGESWAEALYLDTVIALQSVSREEVEAAGLELDHGETAEQVLEAAYAHLRGRGNLLADAAYARLRATMPPLPAVRFSNGDLWLDNFIVRDRKLAAVIDFAYAGYSDPIFEFLLSFFVAPDLRGRGIEERYCERMGFDAGLLPWYRGLEYLDTWLWAVRTGEPFVHHTAESLSLALEGWLDEP
jgi:aminoglycoside phosphotransferase (APT) family kinase protein